MQSGSFLLVTRMVQAGAQVNGDNGSGLSSLLIAARLGLADVVIYLLGQGARADAVDDHGMTAIHHMARSGCVDAVKALLKAGNDANAVAAQGITPLMLAARYGQTDVVRLLALKAPQWRQSMVRETLQSPMRQRTPKWVSSRNW
ncbi:ankyrin repeat domain-containing protein [Comamonas endophytica]|uniref:ankyrin repeat domain-containing protein n=1 Tax=Comamonas endophytica TaxID=2949090 RepID=UPI003607E6E8